MGDVLQNFQYALFGVELFTRILKGNQLWPHQFASGWKKTVLSKQPPSLSKDVFLVATATLVTKRHLDACISVFLEFYGCLRADEITYLASKICASRGTQARKFWTRAKCRLCVLDFRFGGRRLHPPLSPAWAAPLTIGYVEFQCNTLC